jgi:hypothetical protein
VGVTDLSPSIAIDRPLLPIVGRDRSASFAIDQEGIPIHRKDLSPSIAVYRDLHGYMIKSIMMPPKAAGPVSLILEGSVADLAKPVEENCAAGLSRISG